MRLLQTHEKSVIPIQPFAEVASVEHESTRGDCVATTPMREAARRTLRRILGDKVKTIIEINLKRTTDCRELTES